MVLARPDEWETWLYHYSGGLYSYNPKSLRLYSYNPKSLSHTYTLYTPKHPHTHKHTPHHPSHKHTPQTTHLHTHLHTSCTLSSELSLSIRHLLNHSTFGYQSSCDDVSSLAQWWRCIVVSPVQPGLSVFWTTLRSGTSLGKSRWHREPLQDHLSGRLGRWTTPWSAEELLDGQRQEYHWQSTPQFEN